MKRLWLTAACVLCLTGLLPSTCIERVNVYASDSRPGVERVEVPRIMCAGL
jgi:hypothetical protein